MIDPSSRLGRELKAAEEFFALAKSASSPFMREYYRRVAERYLSSHGELKSLRKGHRDIAHARLRRPSRRANARPPSSGRPFTAPRAAPVS
jgi:hypothetical protein